MKIRDRLLRLGVALAISGAIASQIPVSGVTALAQNGCVSNPVVQTGNGGDNHILGIKDRDLLRGIILGLVAYGVIYEIADDDDDEEDAAASAARAPVAERAGR